MRAYRGQAPSALLAPRRAAPSSWGRLVSWGIEYVKPAPEDLGYQRGEPAPKPWVTASDAISREVLAARGAFEPEYASKLGLTQFDGLARDLGPRIVERSAAAMETTLRSLRQRLAAERDPEVRQDVEILIDSLDLRLEGARLSARLELAWFDAPRSIFRGIRDLLDEQVVPERRANALARLSRYVGLHPGSTPLARLARARFEESRKPGRVPRRAGLDCLSRPRHSIELPGV